MHKKEVQKGKQACRQLKIVILYGERRGAPPPRRFLFCQSGDLPKRQMSLFDFLDDDKDDGGDDE